MSSDYGLTGGLGTSAGLVRASLQSFAWNAACTGREGRRQLYSRRLEAVKSVCPAGVNTITGSAEEAEKLVPKILRPSFANSCQ